MVGNASAAEARLEGGHLDTPVSAPAPPLVGGMPPSSVTYEWRRCLRYSTLVTADGASHLWHLNDPTRVAVDALGTANVG